MAFEYKDGAYQVRIWRGMGRQWEAMVRRIREGDITLLDVNGAFKSEDLAWSAAQSVIRVDVWHQRAKQRRAAAPWQDYDVSQMSNLGDD